MKEVNGKQVLLSLSNRMSVKRECKANVLPEQTKTILHLTNEKKADNPIS